MESLETLIAKARTRTMSSEEREEQRRNFAYGNGALANPRITRKSIDATAEKMKQEQQAAA